MCEDRNDRNENEEPDTPDEDIEPPRYEHLTEGYTPPEDDEEEA